MKCKSCDTILRETKLGSGGKGWLTELRCPKCKVLFYIERAIFHRRKTKARST